MKERRKERRKEEREEKKERGREGGRKEEGRLVESIYTAEESGASRGVWSRQRSPVFQEHVCFYSLLHSVPGWGSCG